MAQKSYTVLVVEDEAPMRQTLVDTLSQAGLTILEAPDGKAGLDMALQQHPNLILADNLMPIMNGVDMVAKIREDSWGASVPVVLLTSMYDLNAVNQSLQAGITDYLMKSDVSLDDIVARVKSHLGMA